jgi:UDP-2-acetamido-3-amino-2,3-dideoxy-glucuronate N-acetyltransferase
MIDLLARVDYTATIGAGTSIYQFASVIRCAMVGDDCVIGSCAIVDGARIGNRCRIGHGAQIHPGALLGDDVFFGPGAICCNDLWPSTDKEGFDAEALKLRHTVIIEDGASIGASAVILPGIRIGKGAMIAANATVDEDVPAGSVYRRNDWKSPSKPKHWRELRMRWAK